MQETKKKLSELNDIVKDVPQVLVNARVKVRKDLEEISGYSELVSKIKAELGDRGRVFVRFSGTEPVVRVLVEGMDRQRISAYAEEIAQFLQNQLGR
jgi:phosphoglucosamine mutase